MAAKSTPAKETPKIKKSKNQEMPESLERRISQSDFPCPPMPDAANFVHPIFVDTEWESFIKNIPESERKSIVSEKWLSTPAYIYQVGKYNTNEAVEISCGWFENASDTTKALYAYQRILAEHEAMIAEVRRKGPACFIDYGIDTDVLRLYDFSRSIDAPTVIKRFAMFMMKQILSLENEGIVQFMWDIPATSADTLQYYMYDCAVGLVAFWLNWLDVPTSGMLQKWDITHSDNGIKHLTATMHAIMGITWYGTHVALQSDIRNIINTKGGGKRVPDIVTPAMIANDGIVTIANRYLLEYRQLAQNGTNISAPQRIIIPDVAMHIDDCADRVSLVKFRKRIKNWLGVDVNDMDLDVKEPFRKYIQPCQEWGVPTNMQLLALSARTGSQLYHSWKQYIQEMLDLKLD